MTIEEFDKVRWTGGMKMIHRKEFQGIITETEYGVCSVDFIERLIAFNVENDEDLNWARCENCTLIPQAVRPFRN